MKIKFILFPCLIGLLALTSCDSQGIKKTTTGTKEEVLTTTSDKTTTSLETTTKVVPTETVTTTEVPVTTSGVANGGSYDDGEDWGELHT